MDKSTLCKIVAEETNCNIEDVKKIINSYQETIMDKIYEGHEVELRGFVMFRYKQRKACTAYNPSTGEKYEKPAHYYIQASLSRSFKKKIAGKTIY